MSSYIKTVCLPEDLKVNFPTQSYPSKVEESNLPLYRQNWVKILLTAYNVFLSLGWLYITLAISYRCFQIGFWEGLSLAYEEFSTSVFLLQAVLVVDIINLLVGFVPPPQFGFFHTVSCKVLRRNHIFVTAILHIPEIQKSPFVGLMFIQWGLFDCIRYPFYATNIWRSTPNWLRWLHYSAFYFLYPPGFIIEMVLWWQLMPFIYEMGLYNIPLPGTEYNIFNYYWGMVVYLLWQIYSFPYFFKELHHNRNAALFKTKDSNNKHEKSG